MDLLDQIAEAAPQHQMTVAEARTMTSAARAGDEHAALQLLSNYLPLLKSIVGAELRKHPFVLERDDLISAAVEGFYDALADEPGDPAYHVGMHLRLRVLPRVSDAAARVYRLPVPRMTYLRCMKALADANGDIDAAVELAKEYKTTPETMRAVAAAAGASGHTSFDDAHTGAVEPRFRSQVDAETVTDAHRALDVLDPEQRLVIEALYGFDGQQMSAREAAAALGIPRTSLQRIAKTALQQMQAALGA